MAPHTQPVRHLVVVLGDQLDTDQAALDGFDASADRIVMAEVTGEAEHVWSSKQRIAVFLAAMRHFKARLRQRHWPVDYTRLDDPDAPATLHEAISRAIRKHRPGRLILTRPGAWRAEHMLRTLAGEVGVELEVRPDRSFLCSAEEFAHFAAGRKQLRMEHFYRQMRRKTGLLMDEQGQPVGGKWNYDAANRASFGRDGPDQLPDKDCAAPDATTGEVLRLVNARFADHPGSLDVFDWPVTPGQARKALESFITHRAGRFGTYQDAMCAGQPVLYHSRLSAAMNLKLISPREIVHAMAEAWQTGAVPLNSAEGFIRQIIGWREYVRGVYWRYMPEYLDRNALQVDGELPAFYWTGDTEAACLRECILQTLTSGYAHHIQRLMVTGLLALLLGVRPRRVHEWYLAVYADAVEWVELPNTLGMSQYADGGVMASKPYAASGKYISRMSNYCRACPYDPAASTGEKACPFTTLYWDFLMRNEQRLSDNARMGLQLKNLARLGQDERSRIARRAGRLREGAAF